MFSAIRKLLKDCLTENNGQSYCPFRVGGFGLSCTGIPTFIGNSIWSMFHGHFDVMQFAGAFSTMLGGMAILATGVAVKAKTDTD